MFQKNDFLTKAIKFGVVTVFVTLSNLQASKGNSTMENTNQLATTTYLIPRYPKDSVCPALTSLFGESIDPNGNTLSELQSGIEGGRSGDVIIAPADGVVAGMWQTNLGWGLEWSILIRHTADDLNLSDKSTIYYSEFSHFRKIDIDHLELNMPLKRGQNIGKVASRGGNPNLPPKVHWAVYEVSDTKNSTDKWTKNEFGSDVWQNDKARLINPLFMMSLHHGENNPTDVRIVPFKKDYDYSQFKGFSYFFECKGPPAGG